MTDKIYSIDEIKHLVAPVAKEFELNEIYLFGSYSRDTANKDSDIDLYIPILPSKIGIRYFGMLETLKDTFQKDIDIITDDSIFLSAEEHDKFMLEIMKDRVIIYKLCLRI